MMFTEVGYNAPLQKGLHNFDFVALHPFANREFRYYITINGFGFGWEFLDYGTLDYTCCCILVSFGVSSFLLTPFGCGTDIIRGFLIFVRLPGKI